MLFFGIVKPEEGASVAEEETMYYSLDEMISKCIDILEVNTTNTSVDADESAERRLDRGNATNTRKPDDEASVLPPPKKPILPVWPPTPLVGAGYPVDVDDTEDTEEAEFVFGFNPLPSDSLE